MLGQTVIMINNEFIFCKKIVFQNVALVEFAGNQMRKIRLYSDQRQKTTRQKDKNTARIAKATVN